MWWRLQTARTLAWALLLGAWVGLGSLVQTLAPGPLSAFALLAVWLLALGAFSEAIGRLRLSHRVLRGSLPCAALAAAWAPTAAMHGGGVAALFAALLAWALVVALASATVRTCRRATTARPGTPVGAAAAGAALAWFSVGDITELNALAVRLMLGALVACVLFAVLLPGRDAASGGYRAGLFDCSLPAWSIGAWRTPQRWPVLLASLVMLPMMCSLPLMVSLCRADTVSAQAVLGLHFAAMFIPALLLRARLALGHQAAPACAALLALGALVLVAAPGSAGWWGLTLAHGTAWAVAWSEQLQHGPSRRSAPASPLAGAALNAVFALALGLALATRGLKALAGWHIALGVTAALAAAAGRLRRLHASLRPEAPQTKW